MKDERIIELFFARSEDALRETELKYRNLCLYVASNFLNAREDREEVFNDSLLALWNSIPPERPDNLGAYLSEIVRRQSVNRSRANNAWKRGGGVQIVNDEILSLIPDDKSLSDHYEARVTGRVINDFLETLSSSERRVFVLRYYFDADDRSISEQTGFSHTKIRSMLLRLRKRLAEKLGKEGIIV